MAHRLVQAGEFCGVQATTDAKPRLRFGIEDLLCELDRLRIRLRQRYPNAGQLGTEHELSKLR